MKKHVSCVGVAVLDLIYSVDRIPQDDGKVVSTELTEVGGGMAANAAVAVVRLGGSASWFGRLGNDERGKRVLAGLATEDVTVGGVRLIQDVPSSHSVVLRDAEGRRIVVLYRPTALSPDPGWLDLDRVLDCDVVLADIRWSDGAAYVLAEARRRGVPGVLDADVADPASFHVPVAAASHVVFSRDGLLAASRAEDVEEGLHRMARATDAFVAVTMGAEGVAWLDGGCMQKLPAYDVPVRDTLAAGDVFHGAFALGLAREADILRALRFANAAAAVKCTQKGGRSGIPYARQVDELLSGSSGASVFTRTAGMS